MICCAEDDDDDDIRREKGAQGKLGFNTLNKCSGKTCVFSSPQNSKKNRNKTRDINTPPRGGERDDEESEMPR